jgi:23S rRNA (cytidine1920-2'-O)/16S rRNA (cytidine1409-2'-O)-methyltransferase
MKKKKIRIDELSVQLGLADSLDQIRRHIMAGELRRGDHVYHKAAEKVDPDTPLELKLRGCKWVSMGGLKLEKALSDFCLSPAGARCLDIGASTGGFTHVLLANNALQVVALDVGNQLLDPKIQRNPKVQIMDKTNFRTVNEALLMPPFDLIVTDVSFISLTEILPKAAGLLGPQGKIVALIKPQFEAEKHQIPAGGVITDPELQIQIILNLKKKLEQRLCLEGLSTIPVVSKRKNLEFLSLWSATSSPVSIYSIEEKAIEALVYGANTP